MANCRGYLRLAKFGPGSLLLDGHREYVVVNVVKEGKGFYSYQVFDKETGYLKKLHSYQVEKMEKIGLVNAGNLRILYE